MYRFILLFNLLNSSATDFSVTGSGTCNVQLTVLERFSAILAIYNALQHNINRKNVKIWYYAIIFRKIKRIFWLKKMIFSNAGIQQYVINQKLGVLVPYITKKSSRDYKWGGRILSKIKVKGVYSSSSQSYGGSLAIWDHTWHKRTCSALNPRRRCPCLVFCATEQAINI